MNIKWFMIYCAAALSGVMVGCKTADYVSENKGAIALAAAETGIRLIAYGVAKNNPELAPAIYEISGVLMDIEEALSPDGVYSLVESHIADLEVDDLEASDLRLITYELTRIYSRVYETEGEDLTPIEIQKLFQELAVAIRTGAMMARTPPDEQPVEAGGLTIVFDEIRIVIR